MTTPVPSFLRVHRGEDQAGANLPEPSSTDQFWTAFSAATGWRVDRRHADKVTVLPAVEMDLMSDEPADVQPPVVHDQAKELAEMAATLTSEIAELKTVIRRQEIELAAHAAAQVTDPIPVDRGKAAGNQVEAALRHAIAALGFDSAAIYMLDEDTQFLKTRAVVGLPENRLQDEPRLLRGSRADLEAMVQDCVLIENLNGPLRETWNAPEDAGAAICTVLMRGDLPIGTLWFFAEDATELDETQASIAKMVSHQITMELTEAARLRTEAKSSSSVKAMGEICDWQYSSLPVGNRLSPGWFVDGTIESPKPWAIGWHAWDVLPDGSLMIAMAEADSAGADGAMIAAIARAALSAHTGYRHRPAQMLQRISDTLWQTNTADQLMSVLYARLDPETGAGEVAAAGNLNGLIAGKYGYRPLIGSASGMLASSIDVDCFESTFNLAVGETLLGFGAGVKSDGIGQELVGCCLRSAAQSNRKPLSVLRREMAAFPNRHERGILALTRLSTD